MNDHHRDTPDDDLEQRVQTFLQRNFPQIQIHGGDVVIEELDPEGGSILISLTDACDGCLVAPATIQAIQTRLPRDIP